MTRGMSLLAGDHYCADSVASVTGASSKPRFRTNSELFLPTQPSKNRFASGNSCKDRQRTGESGLLS